MTWQEKFDKLMPSEVVTDRDYYNPWKNDIKQFISNIIDQTREETINDIEESLPKAQKITQKDWLGLDYTLGDVKYREHTYRLLVLDILNKLKK